MVTLNYVEGQLMTTLRSLLLSHLHLKMMEYVEEAPSAMDEYLLQEEVDDVERILVAYVLDVDHVNLLEYFQMKLHKT